MNPNLVNPTPVTPATPVAPAPVVKQSNNNALKIAVAFSIAVAMCGLGFGIFGMTKASQNKVDLSDIEVQVKTETGETTTVKTPEVTTNSDNKQVITIPQAQAQAATPEDLNHYIYIAQWGIKIKFPSTMTVTGYRYSLATVPSIGVFAQNCAENACQYMPDFANPAVSNSPLGAISRVDTTSSIEIDTGLLGTKIVSLGNYDYYYSGPQVVYSTDATEITMETETVQLLKEALTNTANYSEI